MASWSKSETEILKALYAVNKDIECICSRFPTRGKMAIKMKLRNLGVYECTVFKREYKIRGKEEDSTPVKIKPMSFLPIPRIVSDAITAWGGRLVNLNGGYYLDGKRMMIGQLVEKTNRMLKEQGKAQIGREELWIYDK